MTVGTVLAVKAPRFPGHLVMSHRACCQTQAIEIDQVLRVGILQSAGKPGILWSPEGRLQDFRDVPSLFVTKCCRIVRSSQLLLLDGQVNPVELEIRRWGEATARDAK